MDNPAPASLYVFASENPEEVLRAEVSRLRQKVRNTESAHRMLYRILAPWPGARKAMEQIFPEAME